jgi:signal transduction histidine kinase
MDTDPAAAKALLEEMARDMQQALDETGRLAQRIYPPLLEAGGLAAALRSATTSIGGSIVVDVEAAAGCPAEVVRTVYLCCVEMLEHAGAEARVTVTVRKEGRAIGFEIVEDGGRSVPAMARSEVGLDRLRDRIEALGGQLTFQSEPPRISGSVPIS